MTMASSFSHRLWRLTVLLLGALVVTGVAMLLAQRQVTATVGHMVGERVVPLKQLKRIADAYAVDVVDASHKVRDGAMSFAAGVKGIEASRSEAQRAWTDYKAGVLSPSERLLVAEVDRHLGPADAAAQEAANLMRDGSTEGLQAFAATALYPRIDPLSRAIESLVNVQLTLAEQAEASSNRMFDDVMKTSLAAILVVAMVAAWAAKRLVQAITVPLQEVIKVTEAVARGELDVPIHTRGHDEIAQLLQAVDRMKKNLTELAEVDSLTRLLNRRSLERLAAQEVARSRRSGEGWAVLLIDLDHFKLLNDTYGHAAGDDVLRAVGSTLQHLPRATDHVARLGGEEFVVLMCGARDADAAALAERIRKALASLPVTSGFRLMSITASIGVAVAQAAEDLGAVLARADEAMYQAKAKGRNQVVVAPAVPSGATP